MRAMNRRILRKVYVLMDLLRSTVESRSHSYDSIYSTREEKQVYERSGSNFWVRKEKLGLSPNLKEFITWSIPGRQSAPRQPGIQIRAASPVRKGSMMKVHPLDNNVRVSPHTVPLFSWFGMSANQDETLRDQGKITIDQDLREGQRYRNKK